MSKINISSNKFKFQYLIYPVDTNTAHKTKTLLNKKTKIVFLIQTKAIKNQFDRKKNKSLFLFTIKLITVASHCTNYFHQKQQSPEKLYFLCKIKQKKSQDLQVDKNIQFKNQLFIFLAVLIINTKINKNKKKITHHILYATVLPH